MGPMLLPVVLVPLAWLLGTFPSAQLVARARGRDITNEGSGNPGASNVIRVLGWRAGILVLVLDFAKGALAAGVGLALDGRAAALLLGTAAVLGHIFPVWRKGGKGIATAGGALVVLYPVIVVGLALEWFVVARVFKKASLASLIACVAFPVAALVLGYDLWEVAALTLLAVVIVARHAGNIRRLVRREEIDLGSR
jgi:glycerol-3-phosphate acyltransferase PlsY